MEVLCIKYYFELLAVSFSVGDLLKIRIISHTIRREMFDWTSSIHHRKTLGLVKTFSLEATDLRLASGDSGGEKYI